MSEQTPIRDFSTGIWVALGLADENGELTESWIALKRHADTFLPRKLRSVYCGADMVYDVVDLLVKGELTLAPFVNQRDIVEWFKPEIDRHMRRLADRKINNAAPFEPDFDPPSKSLPLEEDLDHLQALTAFAELILADHPELVPVFENVEYTKDRKEMASRTGLSEDDLDRRIRNFLRVAKKFWASRKRQ